MIRSGKRRSPHRKFIMKLSKNTWHFRNWETWLEHSDSKRASKFKRKYRGRVYRSDYPHLDWKQYENLIQEVEDDGFATALYKPGQPANLCIYFWVAILRGPWHRAMRWFSEHEAIAFFTAIAMVIFIIGTAWNLFDPDISWWLPYTMLVSLLAGAVAAGFAGLGIAYFVREKAWPAYKHWLNKQEPREKKDKEPNIFKEHIKAKKSKVCPILEFEER